MSDTTIDPHHMRGQLTSIDDVWQFVFAGNATITVVSKRTDTRFTFKVQQPKEDDGRAWNKDRPFFVKVLSGPNNEEDYVFLGTIWMRPRHAQYNHSTKSRIKLDAPSAAAIRWVVQHLTDPKLLEQVELWHEGRCGRCGRTLTVPASIASGFGPECVQHVSGVVPRRAHEPRTPLEAG